MLSNLLTVKNLILPFSRLKNGCFHRSHRGSPAMLIPVHCVNPNHYHHFHHHHDALSVTVNPAAYVATAAAVSTAATSTAATSCVICHLSSSLFHLHPSRYCPTRQNCTNTLGAFINDVMRLGGGVG